LSKKEPHPLGRGIHPVRLVPSRSTTHCRDVYSD
jgi:hypothetical protein